MGEQKRISDDDSKFVILVYGHELSKCYHADFYRWLVNEKYTNTSNKGYFKNAPWVFVNLHNKTYFPAIPGFKITDVLNDHAVTISEFYKILEEYNKNPDDFDTSETVCATPFVLE